MSDERWKAGLDRWITGNYGEDQFKDEPPEPEERDDECSCGSGEPREPEYDAQGIFLCYVCSQCREEKLSGYRPEILTGYDQSDVDEPIEEDE